MACRGLDSSKQGLPTDFETFAARILRSTAKLLKSAKALKGEPATGRTPPTLPVRKRSHFQRFFNPFT